MLNVFQWNYNDKWINKECISLHVRPLSFEQSPREIVYCSRVAMVWGNTKNIENTIMQV